MSRSERALLDEETYRIIGNLQTEARRHPRVAVERVERMRERMEAYAEADAGERHRILDDVEAELAAIESKLGTESHASADRADDGESAVENHLAKTERRASSFVDDLRDRIDRLREVR